MKPIPFKEQNQNLGHGGNPETSDLLCCVCFDPNGIPMRMSKWKLSEEELKRISETGEIWLGTMGHQGPPPIMATVFHPFNEHGFIPHPEMKPIGSDS